VYTFDSFTPRQLVQKWLISFYAVSLLFDSLMKVRCGLKHVGMLRVTYISKTNACAFCSHVMNNAMWVASGMIFPHRCVAICCSLHLSLPLFFGLFNNREYFVSFSALEASAPLLYPSLLTLSKFPAWAIIKLYWNNTLIS